MKTHPELREESFELEDLIEKYKASNDMENLEKTLKRMIEVLEGLNFSEEDEYLEDVVDCYAQLCQIHKSDIQKLAEDLEKMIEVFEDLMQRDRSETNLFVRHVQKYNKIKGTLQSLKCPHCGEICEKKLDEGFEICSFCHKKWNEMEIDTNAKIEFEEMTIDGIKIVPVPANFMRSLSLTKYVRYVSNDFNQNITSCDYALAVKGDEFVGMFLGISAENQIVRPYADRGKELYFVKILSYKDEETLCAFIKYLKIFAGTRKNSYVEFDSKDKRFEEFYFDLKKQDSVFETDNCIFFQSGCPCTELRMGDLQTRYVCPGEEYDLGVQDPKDIEDGEAVLGYIESENLRFSYDMSYVVGYDTKMDARFGFLVAKFSRVRDEKVYNCCFVKDFYVNREDESKYECAKLLFDFLEKVCKQNFIKYIKLKINDNNHFAEFYSFCKDKLGMTEKEGFLIKKI